MCKMSQTIGKLAMALVKFNTEVETIAKDAKNPHFKNNYATLDNIVEVIRPLLAKQGVIVMQIPGGDGENVIMKTMLLHESGEYMESEALIMRPAKNDPQGVGSCITYARRYSLCSMLSLSTGEDDDGNHASQPQRAAQPPQSAPQGKKCEYCKGTGRVGDGMHANYECSKCNGTGKPPQNAPQPAPQQSQPQAQQSRPNASRSLKQEAIKLSQEQNMDWNDLTRVAARVLDRPIKRVVEIQAESDWEMILNELKSFNLDPVSVEEPLPF